MLGIKRPCGVNDLLDLRVSDLAERLELNRIIEEKIEEKEKEMENLEVDDPFHVKALDKKLKNMNKTWNEAYLERKGLKPDGSSKVEKQNYYYRNGIEVKEVIKDIYQFFGSDLTNLEAACIYSIVKYLMRYKYKGNAEKDLDKLIVNVNWLKEEIKE